MVTAAPARAQEGPSGDEEPSATFESRIEVRLVTLEVRAVDWAGQVRRGLGPGDFVVEVGGRARPVESVDWIEAGPGVGRSADRPGDTAAEPPSLPRRIVVFIQSSAEPHRYLGHRKLFFRIDELLGRLHPTDRVAVVSFQHHLEPRLGFTTDAGAVRSAIDDAIRLRPPPQGWPRGSGPSLRIDPSAASDAAFVEDGLGLVAEAMAALPGEKRILFLGWGLGEEHGGDATPRYRRALEAMRRAPLTVSSIAVGGLAFGVSSNLDLAMGRAALDTGGVHVLMEPFPDLAVERLAATLDGYYLLTFGIDRETEGRVRVRLADRRGRVHFAPKRLVRTADDAMPALEDATTADLRP